jgi:hypothetical protein
LPVADRTRKFQRFPVQGFRSVQVTTCLSYVGQAGQRERQVTAMSELPVDRQALLVQRCGLIQVCVEFREVPET